MTPPDILRRLRELSGAPADATRTPTPRPPREMLPPVPVMRDRMANAMPVAPNPTPAQQLAQLVAEVAPGSGEGIGVRRAVDAAGGGQFGEAAGELGLAALGVIPAGDMLKGLGKGAMEVFHGSRHNFPRFDITKVGKGEGADMYGWGLYFAEEPGVAEKYRQAGQRLTNPNPGHMYRVELGVSPDELFDWDARVGDQSSEWLKALRSINPRVKPDMYGGEAYNLAANRAARMMNQERYGRSAIENVADELGLTLSYDAPGEISLEDMQRHFGQFEGVYDQMTPAQRAIVRAELIDPKAAVSLALRDAGAPGLKYLDMESRIGQYPYTFQVLNTDGSLKAAQSFRTLEDAQAKAPQIIERTKAINPGLEFTTVLKERPQKPPTRNVVMFRDDRIRILEMLAALGMVGAAEELAELKKQPPQEDM